MMYFLIILTIVSILQLILVCCRTNYLTFESVSHTLILSVNAASVSSYYVKRICQRCVPVINNDLK